MNRILSILNHAGMKIDNVACANIGCVGKLYWLDGEVFKFDLAMFKNVKAVIQPAGCFAYQATWALFSQRSSCELEMSYVCKFR